MTKSNQKKVKEVLKAVQKSPLFKRKHLPSICKLALKSASAVSDCKQAGRHKLIEFQTDKMTNLKNFKLVK